MQGLSARAQRFKYLASLVAQAAAEGLERVVARPHRAPGFIEGQARDHVAQALEQLLGHQRRIAERGHGRGIADAVLREHVALLEEARLDVLRRRHHARAGKRHRDVPVQHRGQRVDHRREQDVDLALLIRDQLAVMSRHALHRVAAVHRAAPLAELARLLLRAVGGELDAARLDAERAEEADPELVRGPQVEHARDAHAQLRARLRCGRLRLRPSAAERRLLEPVHQCWDGHP